LSIPVILKVTTRSADILPAPCGRDGCDPVDFRIGV
jgi:hypothetical protein